MSTLSFTTPGKQITIQENRLASHYPVLLCSKTTLGKRSVTQDEIWSKIKDAAASAPLSPTSGLTFDPTLFGERHAPDRRGTLAGIGPENCLNIGSVVNSIYQGIADNLSSMCTPDMLKVR